LDKSSAGLRGSYGVIGDKTI